MDWRLERGYSLESKQEVEDSCHTLQTGVTAERTEISSKEPDIDFVLLLYSDTDDYDYACDRTFYTFDTFNPANLNYLFIYQSSLHTEWVQTQSSRATSSDCQSRRCAHAEARSPRRASRLKLLLSLLPPRPSRLVERTTVVREQSLPSRHPSTTRTPLRPSRR